MATATLPPAARLLDLLSQASLRDCLQWFTREKQWINETHLELCRVPAPTFLERERAEWMLARLVEFGCAASLDRAGNVIAELAGDTETPCVALTAHLDTVLAPRSRDEIVLEPDGRFRGPGVSDNGAGLAALLAVARACTSYRAARHFRGRLLLVANVGEEGEGNLSGMRYLCRQSPLARQIGAFVVLDGANLDHITTRGLGSRRFEVQFTGPGGHSWSDYGIGNPVHALSRAVSLFADTRLNGSPKSAYNVGLIEGGSSINAIPSVARAKVDIRSEDNAQMDQIVEALNTAVARAQELENQRASSGGRLSVRVREIGSRPAAVLPEDAAILSSLRAVDAHLGVRSRADCASTDANIPLSMGIPALSLGAGGQGGGAHTPQEWFKPEGRDLGLKRILLLLWLLLTEAEPA